MDVDEITTLVIDSDIQAKQITWATQAVIGFMKISDETPIVDDEVGEVFTTSSPTSCTGLPPEA